MVSNKRQAKYIISLKSTKAIGYHRSVMCSKMSGFHFVDSYTSENALLHIDFLSCALT